MHWFEPDGSNHVKQSVTMKDIAARLQVSCVTVSKALGGREGVGLELRERIVAVAEEMGYRINTLARGMKQGQSYTIGVLVPERFLEGMHPLYLTMFGHVQQRLEEQAYYGMLLVLKRQEEQAGTMPRAFLEKRIDAFILLGQVAPSYLEALMATGVPLVCLDFYDEHAELDAVIADNFFGAYHLVSHLVRTGHRRIAYVGNLHATSSIQDRYLGCLRALLEHRLEPVAVLSDRDADGHLTIPELPESLPDAFVCNCDRVARTVMNMLAERGVRVPEDVSVTGFDNDSFATLAPGLTTMETHIDEMAAQAVRMVCERLADPTRRHGRLLVPGNLIFRESVQPRTTVSVP